MSTLREINSANTESGATIVEFLFAAPVILILLYAAIGIHARLEERQLLHVALRNSQVLALKGVTTQPQLASESLKQDLLMQNRSHRIFISDSKTELEKNIKVDFNERGYVDPKKAKDVELNLIYSLGLKHPLFGPPSSELAQLGFTKERVQNPEAPVNASDKKRFGVHEDTSYQVLSGMNAVISEYASPAIEKLQNIGISKDLGLFVKDYPYATTVHLKMPEGANFVEKSLIGVLQFATGGAEDQTREAYKFNDVVRGFGRLSDGHLPTDYKLQGVVGYFLGRSLKERKHWGLEAKRTAAADANFLGKISDNFVSECMMNFFAGDDCRNPTWHQHIIRIIAAFKTVVEVVKAFASAGSSLAADSAGDIGEKLSGSVTQKIEENVTKKIEEKTPELGNFLQGSPLVSKLYEQDHFMKQAISPLNNFHNSMFQLKPLAQE